MPISVMLPKKEPPKLGRANTIIFGAIVGSHAYGTNVEGSDIDYKWVYVQSSIDLFLNGYQPQIEISKDEVAYELSRFLELCKKANPTMLELLFSPEDCIIYQHPAWQKIKAIRKGFITKECKMSFVGYAISQIEKAKGLDKKMNWEKERKERKDVLDFCYYLSQDEHSKWGSYPIKQFFTPGQMENMGLSTIPHTKGLYNLFWDTRHNFKGIIQGPDSNDVSLSDIPKDAECVGAIYFNKEAYQLHCKEYNEYQEWLKKRNTQRYVDIENHGQMIDGKNMLHCVRLIETGRDMAYFGELWVRRQNADFLIEIRKGKHDLNKILDHCKDRLADLEKAFDNCKLPDKFQTGNWLKIMNFQIRKEVENQLKDGKIPTQL